MTVPLASGRQFSLEEASRLLPSVKLVTAEAVREAEELSRELRQHGEAHPKHEVLTEQLDSVVSRWASRLKELQVEAKGLWLVDFDNGDGYYCWQYPEEAITHYHAYDEGFSGRMKIVVGGAEAAEPESRPDLRSLFRAPARRYSTRVELERRSEEWNEPARPS